MTTKQIISYIDTLLDTDMSLSDETIFVLKEAKEKLKQDFTNKDIIEIIMMIIALWEISSKIPST